MRSPAPYSAQRTASIIDFISDRALLGPSFTGPSWDRWRAVLRAAFALPMSARDLELFKEVAGNREPPKQVKELVCAIGRGGGKDSIAAALATYIAVTSDFTHLRPGEPGTVMCLAVDRAQAKIAFNYVRAGLEDAPLLKALIKRIDADSIELRNGAEIIVQTANTRAPRGRTICCAIFDEIAHWFGEDFANPDVEIDNAVSPGMMRFPGSLKILISSVHRRQGLLYDKVTQHFGKDSAETLVVLGTAMQFNATLDAAEIDRQLVLDPEKAGAEYLSQWRDDLSTFLDRELVEAAIEKGVIVRPPRRGITYQCFADPSGGRGDAFTAAVGHVEGTSLVVDALYERRPPFDPDNTVAEIGDLAKSYRVNLIRGDDYAADLMVTAFRREQIAYRTLKLGDAEGGGHMGKVTRSEIYLQSAGLFAAGRVRLPDNPRLVHQLIGLERRAARSGHDTVDHAASGHDDLANAVCGLLVALAGRPGPLKLQPQERDRIAMVPRNRFANINRSPQDAFLAGGFRRDRFSRFN